MDLTENELFDVNKYLSIHDYYFLWTITYPTKEMDKESQKYPPILSIPSLLLLEKEVSFQDKHENERTENGISPEEFVSSIIEKTRMIRLPSNNEFRILPVDNINQRLLRLPDELFSPLILSPKPCIKDTYSKKFSFDTLPLPIREMDFDYQCERVILYKKMLNSFPFASNKLRTEAKVDICPLYRAQIWTSMLEVSWPDIVRYDRIDKLSSTSTDRQISVDIPRCHQYNDLLASPQGHCKLTRVLKAWLSLNETRGQVYWQGLDSLAAPFIILNFNNEAQAFACFNKFIKKYLNGFFLKDNSATIQEYLALFQIIVSFHDPLLSNHLALLNFVPDLYAISWFLTMFTHILPLYQIMLLWDTLILGKVL